VGARTLNPAKPGHRMCLPALQIHGPGRTLAPKWKVASGWKLLVACGRKSSVIPAYMCCQIWLKLQFSKTFLECRFNSGFFLVETWRKLASLGISSSYNLGTWPQQYTDMTKRLPCQIIINYLLNMFLKKNYFLKLFIYLFLIILNYGQ